MTTAEIILLILTLIATATSIVVLVVLLRQKANNNAGLDVENKIKTANDEQERRLLDDNNRLRSDVQQIQLNTNKDLSEFKDKLNASIDEKFREVDKTLNDGIIKLSETMNKTVSDNFDKTTQTFTDIKTSMARIDEAQKSLQGVETSITSFTEVLENKKARGSFGEFQLNTILEDVFGYGSPNYKIQVTLSNNYIADAELILPPPLGNIVVDSKFPLDNYKKIYDSSLSQPEKEEAKKQFKTDVKKHLNDIATKYQIKNETSEQAIMFIPSEAVFAEINANYSDLIAESQKKRVWIASPTTLMSILETVQIMLKDQERSKNTKKLFAELDKLAVEFDRFEKRWDSFQGHLNSVVSDASNIKTTTDKITSKFRNINENSSSLSDAEDEREIPTASVEEEEK